MDEPQHKRWVLPAAASAAPRPDPPPPLPRIHQNLRSAVYCAAVAAGGAAEWDFAWSRLQEATVADEADVLMSALACTGHAPLLQRWVVPLPWLP